jgi:hypothetical protein
MRGPSEEPAGLHRQLFTWWGFLPGPWGSMPLSLYSLQVLSLPSNGRSIGMP